MTYRTHPLYKRAQRVSGQPIAWENPDLVRLQYDMRHDFTEKTPTINLIAMTAGVEDAQDLIMALTEIVALPEQGSSHEPVMTYDAALGEGRN
jgi:hypothetical protein